VKAWNRNWLYCDIYFTYTTNRYILFRKKLTIFIYPFVCNSFVFNENPFLTTLVYLQYYSKAVWLFHHFLIMTAVTSILMKTFIAHSTILNVGRHRLVCYSLTYKKEYNIENILLEGRKIQILGYSHKVLLPIPFII
jgi:hypothetical protein